MSKKLISLASAVAVLAGSASQAFAAPQQQENPFAAFYLDALKEGGKLVVYSGGDEKYQADQIKAGFEKAFPGVSVDIKVDLSKYHEGRINKQLAKGELDFDIAYLQTLQDFDLWKAQSALLSYKPLGWEHVYNNFKDPDGTYTALSVIAFTNVSSAATVKEANAPREASDYLDPKWKNKIVLTYPNDDDAVLYQFYKIIEKYGWGYMDKLKAQNVHWVRGTATPATLISKGKGSVTFTTFASLVNYPGAKTRTALPKTDAFLTWGQTAAIFQKAKHPATAKLFMSFMLSKEFQQAWPLWSVRDDIPVIPGYKPLAENTNTSPDDFRAFIHNRPLMEAFRFQMEDIFGTAQGLSPLEDNQ